MALKQREDIYDTLFYNYGKNIFNRQYTKQDNGDSMKLKHKMSMFLFVLVLQGPHKKVLWKPLNVLPIEHIAHWYTFHCLAIQPYNMDQHCSVINQCFVKMVLFYVRAN